MNSKQSENQVQKPQNETDQNLKNTSFGLRSWLTKFFILGLSTIFVLALMIRLTVRDSGGVIPTLVYYMTPIILLSFMAVVILALSWRIRWYRVSLIWGILAVITGWWCWNAQFYQNNYQSGSGDTKRPVMRIVFWNIGDRLWGMDAVLAELRTLDPDIIGLVEAGADSTEMKQFWLNSFPDHHYQIVKNGFVCLSRVPILNHRSGLLSDMGKFERLNVNVSQSSQALLSVYLVDIKSNVLKSRKEALLELAEQVSQVENQPTAVLGDFNTPSDSIHFRPLRKYLKHSFEVSGDGYMATWPLPLPVLDLDSIWVNDQVNAIHSENRWTWVSDHRPVVTEISIK